MLVRSGLLSLAFQILELLEGVQRRATRFILSCNYDPNLRPNYKSRLISLNLLPISYWLECRDLCFAFKCINGSYNIQLSRYARFSSGRTRSSASNLNLRPTYRFRTSLFRDSFFNRIALLWNNLPLVIRQSATFASFKTKLYEFYFNKLDTVFDSLGPRVHSLAPSQTHLSVLYVVLYSNFLYCIIQWVWLKPLIIIIIII